MDATERPKDAPFTPRTTGTCGQAGRAKAHRNAGLTAVTGEADERGHWLGSIATYLVTNRGLQHMNRRDEPAPETTGN